MPSSAMGPSDCAEGVEGISVFLVKETGSKEWFNLSERLGLTYPTHLTPFTSPHCTNQSQQGLVSQVTNMGEN